MNYNLLKQIIELHESGDQEWKTLSAEVKWYDYKDTIIAVRVSKTYYVFQEEYGAISAAIAVREPSAVFICDNYSDLLRNIGRKEGFDSYGFFDGKLLFVNGHGVLAVAYLVEEGQEERDIFYGVRAQKILADVFSKVTPDQQNAITKLLG